MDPYGLLAKLTYTLVVSTHNKLTAKLTAQKEERLLFWQNPLGLGFLCIRTTREIRVFIEQGESDCVNEKDYGWSISHRGLGRTLRQSRRVDEAWLFFLSLSDDDDDADRRRKSTWNVGGCDNKATNTSYTLLVCVFIIYLIS